MADSLDFGDIYQSLPGLLSTFQPSDADRAKAAKMAQLEFFLGMMGAPKGTEFRAIGQSGVQALNDYQTNLRTEQMLRNQNIQAAAPLLQLAIQARMGKQMNDLLNGGGQPPGTLPAGSVGGTGMGGGTASAFGPSSQPGPVSGPGNPSTPDLYTQLTNFNLAQLPYTKQDYSAAIKARFPEPVSMRPGAFGVLPNGNRIYNPQFAPGTMPVDPNNPLAGTVQIPGYTAATGTNAAAAAAGKASGEYPYRIVEGADREGHPVRGTAADVYGTPPLPPQYGGPSAPQPTQSGRPTYYTVSPTVTSPKDLATIQADAQANGFVPMPQQPSGPTRTLVGQSPAELEQQKINMEVGATTPKAEGTGAGENFAKQMATVDNNAAIAAQGRGTIKPMMDALNNFNPNAGAPARMKFAEAIQAIPGLGLTADSPIVKGIAGGDINAMQEFNKLAYGNSMTNLRAAMGSGQRLTQAEVLGNLVNQPNMGLQLAANKAMLQLQDGTYRWQLDKQTAKEDWIHPAPGVTRSYAGFETWWNTNHPITGVDTQGQPYLPSLAQVKAQISQAALGQLTPAGQANPVVVKMLNSGTMSPDDIIRLRNKGYLQ